MIDLAIINAPIEKVLVWLVPVLLVAVFAWCLRIRLANRDTIRNFDVDSTRGRIGSTLFSCVQKKCRLERLSGFIVTSPVDRRLWLKVMFSRSFEEVRLQFSEMANSDEIARFLQDLLFEKRNSGNREDVDSFMVENSDMLPDTLVALCEEYLRIRGECNLSYF